MSKRQINKRQTTRIKNIQTGYCHSLNTEPNLFEGLVITRFGKHAEIETKEEKRVICSIRPNIDSIVTGDQIIWKPEGDNQGVVVSRLPRKSIIGRYDKKGTFKPAAANISQIIVVVAPKPELSWSLLDSYLIMAESLHLNICIVLNKIDLPCDMLREALFTIYEPLHYPIITRSQKITDNHESLKHVLDHQISIFVGQSGVGKSSIIASLLPHEPNIQITALTSNAQLGSHTTSHSRLYHLPSGGALIDSPGIREIGLWHTSLNEVAQGYREFRPFLQQCRFRNCDHQETPGCAIIQALVRGDIKQRRYENFNKIIKQYVK